MTTRHPFSEDTRGVSEFTGVLILVVLTIIITASIGAQVLIENEDEQSARTATFSCQYFGSSSRMLITHEQGATFDAGNLVLRNPNGNQTTWAAVASMAPNETVGPDSIVQLSKGNAYGDPVSEGDKIRVLFVNETGGQRQLDELATGDCS